MFVEILKIAGVTLHWLSQDFISGWAHGSGIEEVLKLSFIFGGQKYMFRYILLVYPERSPTYRANHE